VSECDREATIMRMPWSSRGCCAIGEKRLLWLSVESIIVSCDHGNETRSLKGRKICQVSHNNVSSIYCLYNGNVEMLLSL
jgi:hypothetical protein